GLAVPGKLIVLGVPNDEIRLNGVPARLWRAPHLWSLTGTPIESEDTLAFSILENIRPMIKTDPLEEATDAYARMIEGKARFRMVLVTQDGVAQSGKNAKRREVMASPSPTQGVDSGPGTWSPYCQSNKD